MTKRMLGFALAAVFGSTAIAVPVGATGGDVVKIVTRNQYLGADLTPVVLAQTPQEFIAAATVALTQIAANNFPLRARRLALEVKETRPDLIGLQEVFAFSVNGAHPGVPFVDHLAETLAALAAVGQSYSVAATVEHLDIALPLDVTGDNVPELIGVLDRDVILVRQGVTYAPLSGLFTAGGLCGVPIPSPAPIPPLPATLQSTVSEDGCNYTVVATVNSPLGPIVVQRGFVGIDATVRGRTYRFVNSHLEVREPQPGNPSSAIIQTLQSAELVGTLQALTPPGLPLLLVGDFNSSPLDLPAGGIVPPYQVISGSGYADVWNSNLLRFLDPDGFTCCQQSDLANTSSQLDERIDILFVRGTPFAAIAFVQGRIPIFPLSVPPNWSSDHGAVFGSLVVPR